jgi:hypothetical protein
MKLPFFDKAAAEFGSCCDDLKHAMTIPPNSLFRKSESGVLYLAVGYVQSDEGIGWMDQAVIFCPFCGKRLQSKEEIRMKSAGAPGTQQ